MKFLLVEDDQPDAALATRAWCRGAPRLACLDFKMPLVDGAQEFSATRGDARRGAAPSPSPRRLARSATWCARRAFSWPAINQLPLDA
ncbi:MAG: hypothetical protein JO224_06585 [Pelomonas sp.]|nr:hypothetical protein [Roseateles sp.]